MASLPIRQYAADIIDSVRSNPVVVVLGETGSGKTTQISQILLDAGLAGDGIVAVTQPRRVAAVTVARRVAQERGGEVGQEVGYAVRFEECSSRATRIKYLTDGTLLREILRDPCLSRYSIVILDEAHERSLNTDILFALLKELVSKRDPPLKLVVTSATLDSERFSAYYNGCPVFSVPGRTYPVEIVHSLDDHTTEYFDSAVDTAIDIHLNQPQGDILMFLTGQAEIDRAVKCLNEAVRALPSDVAGDLLVLPIYAALPPEMQARVFRPAPEGARRCIVATNIAETSVTVDGVVYVIDPGMAKLKSYNPASGMDSLQVLPISRVQATQRAGRAGRTRPGKCFRLYTKKFYDYKMENMTPPEIQRTGLAGVVLYLKSLPLDIDVLNFDYLDPPEREALEAALRALYVLDAIDVDGAITALGRRMAQLPLQPQLSRALLAAGELGCLNDMLCLAGMLSVEGSIFFGGKGPDQVLHPSSRGTGGEGGSINAPAASLLSSEARGILESLQAGSLGDHVMYIRLYREWEASGGSFAWVKSMQLDMRAMRLARDIRNQLERALRGVEDNAGVIQPANSLDGGTMCENKSGDTSLDPGTTSSRPPRPRRCTDHDDASVPEGRKRPRIDDRAVSKFYLESDGGSRRGSSEDLHQDSKSASPSQISEISSLKWQRRPDPDFRRLRKALVVGYATQLAHRMPLHNGYRTLGQKPTLAQVHPSCARLTADEDGLLPEWVVYHELVNTGSGTFLSKVCPVDPVWVKPILPRLTDVDVSRLSGGASTVRAQAVAAGGSGSRSGSAQPVNAQAIVRRNSEADVSDARARFLARKAQRAQRSGT